MLGNIRLAVANNLDGLYWINTLISLRRARMHEVDILVDRVT